MRATHGLHGDAGMRARRRVLRSAGALACIGCLPVRALAADLPRIDAMAAWLAGRVPRMERVRLDLPRLADSGLSVPMRIVVTGPFAAGPFVRSIRVFAESNPVPDLAVFDFPLPLERVEIDSRIRLAATQHVAAIAEMTDGRLFGAAMEVVVTLAACMEGT